MVFFTSPLSCSPGAQLGAGVLALGSGLLSHGLLSQVREDDWVFLWPQTPGEIHTLSKAVPFVSCYYFLRVFSPPQTCTPTLHLSPERRVCLRPRGLWDSLQSPAFL